jgi:flagellin
MTVINTNIKALYTENSLQEAQRASLVASKQLATGKRINSSMDDPAGMAVVTRMTQNIKSLQQANLNAGYGISLIQTADAALGSMTTMLQRMSELSLQAQNGTMTNEQRDSLDNEFQQIKDEIVRTSLTTSWNGAPILSGDAGTQVGQPKFTSGARAVVAATTGTPIVLGASDLTIAKGSGGAIAIPASSTTPDTVSMASTLVTSSSRSASAIAIANAINSKTDSTGVVATPQAAEISGLKTTIDSTADVQTNLYVNGVGIPLTLGKDQTAAERRSYIVQTINAGVATHGVTAEDSGLGGLTLQTPDGRNLSVWYDRTVAKASDFGLGAAGNSSEDVDGVTGMLTAETIQTSSTDFVPATTIYGTVSLKSETTFTLATSGNSSALGLKSDTFKAQKISRLDFQVGSQANQIISIELADFGKEGPITNSVTTETVGETVDVKSVDTAKNASIQIAIASEAVSKARSSMGAIINRLQDVADNLTSATTNEIASRSQIEDSDYAAASTELSRTTILQQAATAILAQANTDMQTVMKLLQ